MNYISLVLVMLASLGSENCPLPDASAGTPLDLGDMKGFYLEGDDPVLVQYAPIILVENYGKSFNRIGTPSARYDKDKEEEIYVDPSKASCYTQVKEWQGEHGAYTNLIYRIHFEESASDSKSIGINGGKNTGLLLIVTLNADKKPVLLNAVHTCGCFHALFPTNYLDSSLYPADWDRDKQKVYGETPPGFVSFPETGDAHPVVFLRGGSHRVTDVNAATIETMRTRFELLPMALAPMEALKHLPLGDGETSFYYESGRKKGLVKGAGKSGESVLFGAWMGDANVGQDREYGSKDETGRLFYTTLNRMDKKDSDMSDYRGFLELNGWKM